MEYTVDKKELRKISYEFRVIASRLLSTDHTSGIDNLKRLISYINGTPLIKKFINDNNTQAYDMHQIFNNRNYRERFPIPINAKDEIAFVYQLLCYASENLGMYHVLGYDYSSSAKFQDQVDAFNSIVVNPFINYITAHFQIIMIESGMYDNSDEKYTFNFNGSNTGQINIGQGSSTINATMTNPNIAEIEKLIESILHSINNAEKADVTNDEVKEIVEELRKEVKKQEPSKINLKLYVKRLTQIVSLGATILSLPGQINALIELVKVFF